MHTLMKWLIIIVAFMMLVTMLKVYYGGGESPQDIHDIYPFIRAEVLTNDEG